MINFPGGFTVLMAVYQRDDVDLFIRAVQSVYANTLQPDAFLLVVDGPVPQPLYQAIIMLQSRFSIEVLELPENLGLAYALNAGLKLVRTEWVIRADADDFNIAERFFLQANAIVNSNESIDLIGGAIQEVDTLGNKLSVRRTVGSHLEILSYAAYRNPFNHMTVAYRTERALRCGGYPEIHLKEDYALWAKMLASGSRAVNIPDILVLATTGKDMYKRRGGFRYALAELFLQRHLVSTGFKSIPAALLQGSGRAFVFLLPSVIRGLIYRRFLRSV